MQRLKKQNQKHNKNRLQSNDKKYYNPMLMTLLKTKNARDILCV